MSEITTTEEIKIDIPSLPSIQTDTSIVNIPSETVQTEQKVDEVVQTEQKVEEKPVEVVQTEQKVEEKLIAKASEPEIDFEKITQEGLDVLVARYLEDGVIDNEELVDLVKTTMEIVEKKKEVSGPEKKRLSLLILRKFIQDKIKDYDNLEKLFDKAIDLAVKVSKEGLEKIKFSSDTITETKTAFNLIYQNALSKIEESYPLADDIINNIFDITLYVLQIIEGQTSLSETEKKILLKKIINKVINSLETKLSKEQRDFLLTQVDPTISLVQIGIRAQNGQFEINPVEVIGFFSCITAWFRRCCSKKSSQK